MAREGQAEITAALGGERASVEKERSSREAFSVCQLSQSGKLSPHGNRARQRRGQSASQGARGREMQQSREGEAVPLCELCIGAPIREERIKGEAEPSKEGAELLRRPRSSAKLERSGRSEESRGHRKEGGERGGLEASSEGRSSEGERRKEELGRGLREPEKKGLELRQSREGEGGRGEAGALAQDVGAVREGELKASRHSEETEEGSARESQSRGGEHGRQREGLPLERGGQRIRSGRASLPHRKLQRQP